MATAYIAVSYNVQCILRGSQLHDLPREIANRSVGSPGHLDTIMRIPGHHKAGVLKHPVAIMLRDTSESKEPAVLPAFFPSLLSLWNSKPSLQSQPQLYTYPDLLTLSVGSAAVSLSPKNIPGKLAWAHVK